MQISVSSFHEHDRGSLGMENALKSFTVVPKEKQEPYSLLDTSIGSKHIDVEHSEPGHSRPEEKFKVDKEFGNKGNSKEPQLTNLLKRILDEDFTIVLDKDTKGHIIDFHLLDSQGVDCREHVSIVYVAPLPYEKAKGASSVPKYVEFLCREGFPKDLQNLLPTDD